MKVSVPLPGNSANTICMTSEKEKVARQQQIARAAIQKFRLEVCKMKKDRKFPNFAAFQCQGLLFWTLLIERSHQRQLTLKAALKYNAVLAPRLTSASRDEPFTWQKIARLEGCPGQVDRVPRQGGLPCLACKRFNEFSKETYEKLALPG